MNTENSIANSSSNQTWNIISISQLAPEIQCWNIINIFAENSGMKVVKLFDFWQPNQLDLYAKLVDTPLSWCWDTSFMKREIDSLTDTLKA